MEENDLLKKLYKQIDALKQENKLLREKVKDQNLNHPETNPSDNYKHVQPLSSRNLFDNITDMVCIIDKEGNFHRKIVENMTELISITDHKGKFSYVSPSHYQILGYTPEELKGRSIFDFLHPKDTATIYSLFKEKIKKQSSGTTEYRYQTKDGKYLWMESFGKTLLDENNKSKGAIFTTREVTKQKVAHEKLTFLSESGTKFLQIPTEEELYQYIGRKLKNKFRKAIITVNSYNSENQSLSTEFVKGRDNQLSKIRQMTGKHPAEMSYKVSPEDSNLMSGKLKYLSLQTFNYNFRDLPGKTIKKIKEHFGFEHLYYIGLCIGNEIFGSISIITPDEEVKDFKKTLELFARQASLALYRKKIEKQYFNAKKKAEESDRLKSAFLANMSHEIRTPMNGILGFSQLLKAKSYPPEKESLFLTQIINNSKQLLTLINDIIDISKIEAHQLKINETEINLNVVVDELFNLFDKERNEELKLISYKGLKEEESNVVTDPDRLKQVMNNLLSNALKFTESGSVTFGYEKKDNNTLLFYVKDTGIGISMEQQNIIFDRFKQAEDGTTKKFSGTGLGLAISKELIELMGGNIWVTSQIMKGSEFAFTIPFKQGRNTQTQSVENSHPTVYNWSDKTILVVEDHEANYLFLQTCLEETGCTVIRAADGKAAIEKGLNSEAIDLILMDIQLPIIDGITATKEIKKHKRELPIIAQTAYAMQGDKEKTIDAGCNDYIEKPIEPQKLLKIISEFF